MTRMLPMLFLLTGLVGTGCAANTTATDESSARSAEALTVYWTHVSPGMAIPSNAFVGGSEPIPGGYRNLQICRASRDGGMHPGKVIGTACSYPYGGGEQWAGDFDVLIVPQADAFWHATGQAGSLPAFALQGGWEANGTALWICRAHYAGGLHPGKVVGRMCNISYGGSEIPNPTYDVLALQPHLNVDLRKPLGTIPQVHPWHATGSNFTPNGSVDWKMTWPDRTWSSGSASINGNGDFDLGARSDACTPGITPGARTLYVYDRSTGEWLSQVLFNC